MTATPTGCYQHVPQVTLPMIDSNSSPSSMKSMVQSVKLPHSGESVPAESVDIEAASASTTTSSSTTTTALRASPFAHSSSLRANNPMEVFNHDSAGCTDHHSNSRMKAHAVEGCGSPGLFGAAMLLLRGSTKARGDTSHCNTMGSGGTDSSTKSVAAVDAVTPEESKGEFALDGCLHRDGQPGEEQRCGSLRAASGPYQHALFTAPDSLQEHDSDRLPLVTIHVSSHSILPEKRRPRTKHVVTHKKRKVIHSHPSSGASTVPSAQTRRTVMGGSNKGKAELVPTIAAEPADKEAVVVQSREPSRPSNPCPKASALSTESYGITKRLSDKYQAQVFFAKKSRYIGVFQSAADAALAVSEAKKVLSKYEKPFEGDGDAAFKKARDVALKATRKVLSRTDPNKVVHHTSSTRTRASLGARNVAAKDRMDAKRKPKAKENRTEPSSPSSTGSKSKPDTSLSLLLLAAAADAENDRGAKGNKPKSETSVPADEKVDLAKTKRNTKMNKPSSTTSKSAIDSVDLAETKDDSTAGSENASSLPKQPTVSAAGKKVTFLNKADPRFRAPGVPPHSRTPPSSTTTCTLAEGRPCPPESFEYVSCKRVYPSREVFITLDRENSVYEVHVSDDNLLPENVMSLGPTKKLDKAQELFEIVCSIANHAGEKYWYVLPELAGALDLNKRMVPHMPPPLVRGYLGIAFVVATLDWHVYGYLKDKPEPALIGKYRIFVDAVFAYNTAARMQRYPALYEEHRLVALKVKDEVLAYVVATRPNCNMQREHQIRFSVSNIRCMLAHGMSPGRGSSGRGSSASASKSEAKPQSTIASLKPSS